MSTNDFLSFHSVHTSPVWRNAALYDAASPENKVGDCSFSSASLFQSNFKISPMVCLESTSGQQRRKRKSIPEVTTLQKLRFETNVKKWTISVFFCKKKGFQKMFSLRNICIRKNLRAGAVHQRCCWCSWTVT